MEIYQKSETKKGMKFSENQLYSLSSLNKFSLTKVNSENSFKFFRLHLFEKKIKHKLVKLLSFGCPNSFFKIEEVQSYFKLSKEFKDNN